jgi:Methane oxygenase PmoA
VPETRYIVKFQLLWCLLMWPAASLQGAEEFAAEKKDDRVVITRGGKPLAHYVFNDPQIPRPYFAHVRTLAGVQVTRTHPPVEGQDPVDHAAMHPGIWLAFADVSGHDFWRNKATTMHEKFTTEPAAKDGALTFATLSKLMPRDGAALAEMNSAFTVTMGLQGWLLTWDATIVPMGDGLYFGDQEEMGLGVRVASGLAELKGGTITSSTGKKGAKETWGRQADWCDYAGMIGGKRCGLLLMASPDNFGQSWFHNRDYGLMVANAFGRKAFTKGEASRVVVEKGKPLRLRHAVLVHDGFDPGPETGAAAEWKHYLAVSAAG